MNSTKNQDDLTDPRAERRDKKRKPKMCQHGRELKKSSARSALHIAKVERKRKI